MNGRYFGGVTAASGREPARAGHEPVRRRRQARRSGWRGGPRLSGGRASPVAGPLRPARLRPRPRRGHYGGVQLASAHINWPGQPFNGAGRQAGFRGNSGPFRPLGNRRPARSCARFAGLLPGLAGRAGASPAEVLAAAPAQAVRLAPGRPRLGVKRRWPLFSCPARPPAAGGTTKGHRSWPERCSACICLVTHSNMGPV